MGRQRRGLEAADQRQENSTIASRLLHFYRSFFFNLSLESVFCFFHLSCGEAPGGPDEAPAGLPEARPQHFLLDCYHMYRFCRRVLSLLVFLRLSFLSLLNHVYRFSIMWSRLGLRIYCCYIIWRATLGSG